MPLSIHKSVLLRWEIAMLLHQTTLKNFSPPNSHLQINLTTVELDPVMPPVARDWFGLVENESNRVVVQDGAAFIDENAKNGKDDRRWFISIKQMVHIMLRDKVQGSVCRRLLRILSRRSVYGTRCSEDCCSHRRRER